MEEVICRINPANSALFAGLIWQIVFYLPDYFPANNALFAGFIRRIVSYLPDYENEVLQGYIYMVLYGTGVTGQGYHVMNEISRV